MRRKISGWLVIEKEKPVVYKKSPVFREVSGSFVPIPETIIVAQRLIGAGSGSWSEKWQPFFIYYRLLNEEILLVTGHPAVGTNESMITFRFAWAGMKCKNRSLPNTTGTSKTELKTWTGIMLKIAFSCPGSYSRVRHRIAPQWVTPRHLCFRLWWTSWMYRAIKFKKWKFVSLLTAPETWPIIFLKTKG